MATADCEPSVAPYPALDGGSSGFRSLHLGIKNERLQPALIHAYWM